MTKRNHPIDEVKFNKYKEQRIEKQGAEGYYEYERKQVEKAMAELTNEFLESFNRYFTTQITKGIVQGFKKTHRQIQADALNGMVQVFGELAKGLETNEYDARNEYALKMVQNMYIAATNTKVIDFIEKIKKE
jgi:hypothetical protein